MLSATTEHALRALVELATLPAGESMLGRELAQRTQIPANYLSKILWALGHAGMIDAVRGSKGGYRLRRSPGTIHLIEVIDLLERPVSCARCVLNVARDCSEANPCVAHEGWREVRVAFMKFVEGTTIAELAQRRVKAGSENGGLSGEKRQENARG